MLVDVVLPATAVPGTSTTAVHLGHFALRPANLASILKRAVQLSQRQMISPAITLPRGTLRGRNDTKVQRRLAQQGSWWAYVSARSVA